jgi:hypothetical protein
MTGMTAAFPSACRVDFRWRGETYGMTARVLQSKPGTEQSFASFVQRGTP